MYQTRIVGYTYRAEQLCPNCTIEALKTENRAEPYDSSDEDTFRTIAEREGIDYDDLYSYDSGDFPKPVGNWQLDCTDEDHETCGACGMLLCDH